METTLPGFGRLVRAPALVVMQKKDLTGRRTRQGLRIAAINRLAEAELNLRRPRLGRQDIPAETFFKIRGK